MFYIRFLVSFFHDRTSLPAALSAAAVQWYVYGVGSDIKKEKKTSTSTASAILQSQSIFSSLSVLWPLPALAAAAKYESQFQRLHVIFLFRGTLCDTFTLFIPQSRVSKQDKLKHQFHSDAADVSSSRVAFFHGVHVYVNGYTQPDSLTIKNMLAAHGGVWEQYNGRFDSHK